MYVVYKDVPIAWYPNKVDAQSYAVTIDALVCKIEQGPIQLHKLSKRMHNHKCVAVHCDCLHPEEVWKIWSNELGEMEYQGSFDEGEKLWLVYKVIYKDKTYSLHYTENDSISIFVKEV